MVDGIRSAVKAARTFSRSQLAGLKAIAGLPGVVRRILVYGGVDQLEVADGVEVWPVRHFCEALAEDLMFVTSLVVLGGEFWDKLR